MKYTKGFKKDLRNFIYITSDVVYKLKDYNEQTLRSYISDMLDDRYICINTKSENGNYFSVQVFIEDELMYENDNLDNRKIAFEDGLKFVLDYNY